MVEVRISPVLGRRVAGRGEEDRPVAVAHLGHRHLEGVYPDAMDRLFLVATRLTAHEEIPGGNRDAARLESRWARSGSTTRQNVRFRSHLR